MPITRSAKKKLRQDRDRSTRNRQRQQAMKKAIRSARTKPTPKTLSSAYRAIDMAAKGSIIHKNKAARLKSRLAQKISAKSRSAYG